MKLNKNALFAIVAAAALGTFAVTGTRELFAADKSTTEHGGGHHDQTALVKEHLSMMQDPQHMGMMKEHMTMMMAHQMLLHEITEDPETAKLLRKAVQDPKMKKMLDEVKASMKDHDTQHAKKDEVAKSQKEIMMVLAHALMRQDAEAMKLMGEEKMMKAHE